MDEQSPSDLPEEVQPKFHRPVCVGTIVHVEGGASTYLRGVKPSEVLEQLGQGVIDNPDPTKPPGTIVDEFRFLHDENSEFTPNGVIVNVSKVTMLAANWR